MASRIVTSAYRYKRPPRKRAKAAAIDIEPLIVTVKQPKPRKSGDPPVRRLGAASPADTAQPKASGSAVVTVRRPGKRYAHVPDTTEEEHHAAGDRADVLMQEFKRKIAEKVREGGEAQ